MAFSNSITKYLLGIVAFAALVVYSLFSSSSKTREQVEYQNWFDEVKNQSRIVDRANPSETAIRIRVISAIPTIPLNWELVEQSKGQLDERVFRVMNLIEEANLELATLVPEQVPEGKLVISVSSPGKKFATMLDEPSIRKNLKLMNLLKVIEIYTITPTASPTTIATTPPDYLLKQEDSSEPSEGAPQSEE